MTSRRLLRRVVLSPRHAPTGRTRHSHGSKELPPPSELRIVQYVGDTGYYLFYCDTNGREITDTYHDTLEHALEQAKWEFTVTPEEWEEVEE